MKALSKLSDETLSKNPHLKDRKFENSKTEYKDYKYNPSYSSNRNSTRLDRMMRLKFFYISPKKEILQRLSDVKNLFNHAFSTLLALIICSFPI